MIVSSADDGGGVGHDEVALDGTGGGAGDANDAASAADHDGDVGEEDHARSGDDHWADESTGFRDADDGSLAVDSHAK